MTVNYDWNSMTPRERDALVAEKVMGWTDVKYASDIDWFMGIEPEQTDYGISFIGEYTTDISEAWAVLNKLKERVEYVRTTITDSRRGIKVCVQTIGYSYRAESVSLAEAICLAALRACGVEIPV